MSELDEIDTNSMVPGLPANTIIKTVLKARMSTGDAGDTVCSECESELDEIDTFLTDKLICPHCGAENYDEENEPDSEKKE